MVESAADIIKAFIEAGHVALAVSLVFNFLQVIALWQVVKFTLRLYADRLAQEAAHVETVTTASSTISTLVEQMRALVDTTAETRAIVEQNQSTAREVAIRLESELSRR